MADHGVAWRGGLKRAALAVLVVGATVACTVRLTDETLAPLRYNEDDNRQRFSALVTPVGVEITSVTLNTGAETVALDAPEDTTTAGRWDGVIPLPRCEEAVEYTYQVEYEAPFLIAPLTRRRTFPEIGAYRARITDLPAECEAQPQDFSQAWRVNDTRDLADRSPGDGVCDSGATTQDGEQACTLRAAVMEANARPGLDLILVPSGVYRLSLGEGEAAPLSEADASTGDLDITDPVRIEGDVAGFVGFDSSLKRRVLAALAPDGAREAYDDFLLPTNNPVLPIIDAGARVEARGERYVDTDAAAGAILGDRVFQIHGGMTGFVELNSLIIRGGGGNEPGEAPRGAGIYNGGALRMERVALIDNVSTLDFMAAASRSAGGAIYNAGELRFFEGVMARNQGEFGAALYATAGSRADLERVFVWQSQANRGGLAISGRAEADGTPGAQINLTNVSVTETFDLSAGGQTAVSIRGAGKLAHVTLADTTFVNRPAEHVRTLLNASADVSIGGSLILQSARVADRACIGRFVSVGGNVVAEDCLRSASRGTPDTIYPDTSRPVLFNDECGFYGGRVPSCPIAPVGAFTPPISAVDRGLFLTTIVTDTRGRDRSFDGDASGEAQPDAGAFEWRAGDAPRL